jgi:hypothetical protein
VPTADFALGERYAVDFRDGEHLVLDSRGQVVARTPREAVGWVVTRSAAWQITLCSRWFSSVITAIDAHGVAAVSARPKLMPGRYALRFASGADGVLRSDRRRSAWEVVIGGRRLVSYEPKREAGIRRVTASKEVTEIQTHGDLNDVSVLPLVVVFCLQVIKADLDATTSLPGMEGPYGG